MTFTRGFIYAVTNEQYLTLARRSARRLKMIMPDAVIDLFADQDIEDPVFDRIYRLEQEGPRPKMEGLRRSRFDQTVFLDADIITLHPFWDIFALLERHDIVAAHENYRNSPSSLQHWREPIPPAFPEVNTGVLGIRKTAGTLALMDRWDQAFRASGLPRDQPVFRRLLLDSDLRLGILPLDYNLMHPRMMLPMGKLMATPRVLHVTRLHRPENDPGDPMTPLDPANWLTPRAMKAWEELRGRDRTLAASAQIPPKPDNTPPGSLRALTRRGYWSARRRLGRVARQLGLRTP